MDLFTTCNTSGKFVKDGTWLNAISVRQKNILNATSYTDSQ